MDERTVSDGELIARYLQHDPTAFDDLYQRYRRPVYGYLNQYLPGRSAVVDDLFQQTWIKALEAMPRYRDQERFLPWLLRIAHNLVMDFFRSRAEAWASTDPDELEGLAGIDDRPDPLEAMADAELQAAVERAVAQLSPEQREVLALRRQGIQFKEIARIQGTNINTVLGRMHYAVQRLRRLVRGV